MLLFCSYLRKKCFSVVKYWTKEIEVVKMKLKIKKDNERNTIAIIVLLIMSSGGLSLFTLEATNITPFYIVGVLTIIVFILQHPRLEQLQAKVLVWSLIAIGISFALIKNTKISSILHFAFYVWSAVSIISLYKINRYSLRKLAEIIIYANLTNIVLAMLLYNLGVSVPSILGTYYDRGIMRYMGFTSEPSYLAMVSTVSLLMTFIEEGSNTVRSSKDTKTNRWMLTAYVVMIILSKTSFGLISILFVGIVWFQDQFGFKNASRSTIIGFVFSIILIIGAGIVYIVSFDNEFLNRLVMIFELLFRSSSIREFQTSLRVIDSSAWYRIGPLLLAIEDANLSSFTTWFGHGIGADAEYFTTITNSNTVIRGGFLQAGFYNHGIIGLISFLVMIIRKIKGIGLINIIYLILCFFNCSISTQVFWFIIIIYLQTSKCISIQNNSSQFS